MEIKKTARLILTFSVIFGMSFALCGISSIISSVSRIVRCSESISGTIVSYDVETTRDEDGEDTHYYPVYRYTYNNNEYTQVSPVQDMLFKRGSIGDEVTLHINPDDPTDVYGSISPIVFIADFIFIAVGVTVMLKSVHIYSEWKKHKENIKDV